MKFCDKFIELRKKAVLSQEQLADKLNVSRQAISKWECGDSYPDTEKLIAIAKLFGVSLDYLVFDKGFSGVDEKEDNIEKEYQKIEKKRKTGFSILIALCIVLFVSVVVLSVFAFQYPKESNLTSVKIDYDITTEYSTIDYIGKIKLTLVVDDFSIGKVKVVVVGDNGEERSFDATSSGDYSYSATIDLSLYDDYKIFAEINNKLYKVVNINMDSQNSYTTWK